MSETLHDTIDGSITFNQDDHAADAEAIIEEIERPRQYEPDQSVTRERPDGDLETVQVEDAEDRWLPRMELPGFGEERDTCGEEMYRFCSCCGESVQIGQTCRQSRCPRCAQEWCRIAATRVCSKLSALWAYKYHSLDSHPFFHHLVISPPDDWRLSDSPDTVFERTKSVVLEIMDELGIDGLPIYHPFRGEDEDETDMGEWKNRVFEGLEWDEVSGELRFSPHFHIIGVAPYIDIGVTERVEEATGWVIHRITQEGSNVSIGNDFDMARAVSYCLSHCGVYETESGQNRGAYFPNCIGRSTPESTEITANEETEDEMDRIVRSVVPETLGIPFRSVACARKVPKGNGANLSVAVTAGVADGDGDGDGDSSSDEPDPDEGDDPEMERCEGRMENIAKAPEYLNDPEWRANASRAKQLERRYQEWKRERGIAA